MGRWYLIQQVILNSDIPVSHLARSPTHAQMMTGIKGHLAEEEARPVVVEVDRRRAAEVLVAAVVVLRLGVVPLHPAVVAVQAPMCRVRAIAVAMNKHLQRVKKNGNI